MVSEILVSHLVSHLVGIVIDQPSPKRYGWQAKLTTKARFAGFSETRRSISKKSVIKIMFRCSKEPGLRYTAKTSSSGFCLYIYDSTRIEFYVNFSGLIFLFFKFGFCITTDTSGRRPSRKWQDIIHHTMMQRDDCGHYPGI